MSIDTLSKVFELLGLEPAAYLVYSSLSSNPNQTLTQVTQQLSLHRPRLYQILEDLQRYNLITRVGKKWIITDPMNLLVQLRHNSHQIQSVSSTLEDIMPELRARFNFIEDQKLINLEYSRLKIIKQYYDMLDPTKGEMQYIFNCGDELINLFGVDFKEYGILRNKYGIKLKILSNPSDQIHKVNKDYFANLNAEIRYLPTQYIRLPAFIIFGQQTIYWEPEIPRNIVLNDQRIADLNVEIFDEIWNGL